MSSAIVNSILARCLTDAAFLEHLERNTSAALKSYNLDPKTYAEFVKLDLGRMRNLAGQITKVQNNGLWEHFLHTRMLLRHYGIEFEVFVAYRDSHAQNRKNRLAQKQQFDHFSAFLLNYIGSQEPSRYPALRDILVHERTTWQMRLSYGADEVRTLNPPEIDFSSLSYSRFRKFVPAIIGSFQVEEFNYDPLEVTLLLTQGEFDHQRLTPGRRWFGYWADGATRRLRVLALDPAIAALLAQVNGERSVRTIVRRAMRGAPSPVPPSEFQQFFERAFQEGLLTFRSGA